MKKILGLDLGTNSIGWALIKSDFDKKEGEIVKLGSRIIPMSQEILGKFDSGVSISQTAERTAYRSMRRINERSKLRRDRLHRVLNILNFLPHHYAEAIDFEINYGQFKDGKEVKINYKINGLGTHEFIFKDSFDEMAKEFAEKGLEKVPYDWTIYYLRKKALIRKVSKEELSWILLNFNQKRGYYQLRGEEEKEDEAKIKEYCVLKVNQIVATGEQVKGKPLYDVIFDNGWIYDKQIVKTEEWEGKVREFIVTTTLEKDGTPKVDKEGNPKRSFKQVDSESDWIAIKKKTEQDIENSNKTIGEYIYDTLLDKPSQKIRGKLIRTIERKFYKDELIKILSKQLEFHPELQDAILYTKCVEELYPRNEGHKQELLNKDGSRRFTDLFVEDIIFYQRPLRSQKSNISNCQYEFRTYVKPEVNEETGMPTGRKILEKQPIKATPRSNPYFQEFRIWQFLRNLSIKEKDAIVDGKPAKDHDVTNQFLPTEENWFGLFEFFNSRKEIDQKQFLGYFAKNKVIDKIDRDKYRWNYVEDKSYPVNETKALFLTRLAKVPGVNPDEFLTYEREYNLWHMVYSIKDRKEFKKALGSFAKKNKIDEETFIEAFKKVPPFDNEYAAYSEKAIKKLLPLMRIGKYWNENEIPEELKKRVGEINERLKSIDYVKERIEKVADDDIPKPLLKSFVNFGDRNKLKGLNTYQACYLVYNRHSETSEITRWKTPEDISNYISNFKQHSLRNPIVEQVVTETLRVVKDIWEFYGSGKPGFFNEVHIELGREMKNPANIRKQISAKISENENTNHRIRELLTELMNDSKVEGEVRPYSPSHQEILKIYEEGVYQNPNADFRKLSEDDVEKIRRNNSPSRSDIQKYKLWLEQAYISPYTGKPIPLSKLFTTDYQIEHVIPQSRYFDDSLSNKIICESEINQLKDNRTAYQFLKEESGRIFECTQGKTVKLLTLDDYTKHCNKYFKRNRGKLKKLLSEEIPEGFIERQMNDSRYISKLVKTLLSNLVREENEQEAISKYIVPVPGAITSILKNDWGLNDKWNEIVAQDFSD
ncbi:MAG: HNH endonuclease domain-containing protein [Bacteroidota bacterium]|nr:HNH endonuclease domain-containing protein [Bacteroidota bacterium]